MFQDLICIFDTDFSTHFSYLLNAASADNALEKKDDYFITKSPK